MPDADPYNGKLDLILLNAKRIREWINTAKSFVWDNGIQKIIGQQDSAKDAATVAHRQATEISASLSEPRVLEVDDEDLGKVSQFSGEVQPAALFAR